jgi:hypothetical protein
MVRTSGEMFVFTVVFIWMDEHPVMSSLPCCCFLVELRTWNLA